MAKTEIIFSGVGGQGLLINGFVLGGAASILDQKQAIMSCEYGDETRGSFTKADVIISDEYIDFPEVLSPDVVVSLAQLAYDRYYDKMKDGSILIYNSNAIEEAPSAAKQYGINFVDLAKEIGSPVVLNIIALGATIAITECANPESVKARLADRFADKPTAVELNAKAFDLGYSVGLAAK